MKTCPVCDLELEDSYSFCPEDGSSLQNQVSSQSIIDPPSAESDDEMRSVVLSCPNCAAEYPLTFSECPVHGVTLTKHPRPTARSQSGSVAAVPALSAAAGLQFIAETDPSTTNIHSIDSPSDAPKIADHVNSTESISQNLNNDDAIATNRFPDALRSFENMNDERPGFRIAAIITAIALAIFAAASLYGFVNHLSRRRSTVAQIAKIEDEKPLPFVATPQQAQDYTDEQLYSPEPSAPSQPATEPRTERHNSDLSALPSNDHTAHKITLTQAPKPTSSTTTSQTHQSPAPIAPAPALPRGNSGGFDSRLVRERGSRTSSGYRYELTFNMLEQGGRSAQWQRVLISSHSASGINHTQALPFVHRLGAAGALTFTISIELAGRSEPDWRGRVICTALGWDNSGAPLQSSFGANLAP